METIISYAKESVKLQKKIIFNAGIEASLDYANPQKNRVPKVQLLFSPFGLPFIPLEIIASDVKKIITSYSWTKDRNNAGGTAVFTLVPDKSILDELLRAIDKISGNLYSKIWNLFGIDLEDLFKPMTLCQLWIDGYHVMTGKVRSCKRSSAVGNEEKEVFYTLIIDELGMLYDSQIVSMDTILFDNLQRNILDSDTKALEVAANIKGVPLAEGIKALCTAFLATFMSQGITASDGFPITMRMLALPNPLGGIANSSFARNMIVDTAMFELAGGQSFWEFLKNFIPNPWMEFYTESGGRTMVTDGMGAPSVLFPGMNYIVARSLPYSNPLLGFVHPVRLAETIPYELSALQMLLGGDFIIITDEDEISNKELGVDSSNQHTVFHTRYGGGASIYPMDNNDRPIHSVGPLNPFASGGVGTFGRRDMFQSINCACLYNLGTARSYVERISRNLLGIPQQEMSKAALSNLLAVWFRNQSRFREGSVTTRSIPYARPGMYCLYLPSLSGKKPENIRDIGIYYIDSLTHSGVLSDKSVSATTTLNLVRGVPLPTTLAQAALLLFDWEILPPESGMTDGEYTALKALRKGISI